MRRIPFTKIVATGNDFILVDNRSSSIGTNRPFFAKKVCDRRFGVGADGLLLLERSKDADFKMRIFNPDGSEAEMCGNGSRCIALYAKLNRIAGSHMSIETKVGLLSANAKGAHVRIKMTDPKDIKPGVDIEVEGETCQTHYVNTGVPHAVYFVDELDRMDVQVLGSKIRHHRAFKPSGTNVDFVQVKDKGRILMRTYERGVEAETLACGTGAAASAVISSLIKGYNSPVKVHTAGGILTVYFKKAKERFLDVWLEGEAHITFKGEYTLA